MVEKTIILGAGVVGLTTAYELLKRGHQIQIIEQNDYVGGLASSFDWHGFPCDLGPHIYHSPDQEIVKYWNTEFQELLHERKHWSNNYKNGDYCPYPISREYLDQLPPELSKKIKNELASDNKFPDVDNFYDYMKIIAGPTLQKMFFIDYPEKLWGVSTKELDSNWAPKRLSIREKNTPFYWGQYSAVGTEGSGSIMNALYEKVVSLGGEVSLNESIIGLSTRNEQITSIETSSRHIEVFANQNIVSTIPITVLSSMLGTDCNLTFRGVIIVYLLTGRREIMPDGIDFIYFDSKHIVFNRMTYQRSFVAKAPEDKDVYMLEITYSEGDRLSEMDNQELVDLVLDNLEELDYFSRKDITDTLVKRIPRVYPMLIKGYRDHLAQAKSTSDHYSNLYTLGTLAEFAYSDMQILFSKSIDMAHLLTDKTMSVNRLRKNQPRLRFNQIISVDDILIGKDYPTFFIAEIGLNHNGDLNCAKQLIDKAIEAGAHAVKLQSYFAKNRVAKSGRTSRHVEKILGIEETDYEMLKRFELSPEDTKELFDYAENRILIFSTPFDEDNVDILESLNVKCYKIASFDIVNLPLLSKVAKTGKPMIISTGMSNLSEVEDALSEVIKYNNNVILLHCTSSYPCPPENMNLKAMDTLRDAFKVPVGLSDHSVGHTVSLSAAARGANIIEKHFTLNRNMEGPDHSVSLEPEELIFFINQLNVVHQSLGDGIKQPSQNEFNTMLRFRKTIYSATSISKGQSIQKEHLCIKGPAFGIYPKFMEIIIGQTAKYDIEEDTPITWNLFQ